MFELLHVAEPSTYEQATEAYAPASLASEGFVHCCYPNQLMGVLERWFPSSNELLLLALDEEALSDVTKKERGPGGQLFPHVYAPIPKSVVLAVNPLSRDKCNNWIFPRFLTERILPDSA